MVRFISKNDWIKACTSTTIPCSLWCESLRSTYLTCLQQSKLATKRRTCHDFSMFFGQKLDLKYKIFFTQYSRGIWSLSDLLTLDKFLFHIQKTHSEKMCIFHRWGMKIQLCWPFLQKGTYTKWNCQFWMGIALHISWTTNSTCHRDISNCRRKGNEISENAGKIFWELFT